MTDKFIQQTKHAIKINMKITGHAVSLNYVLNMLKILLTCKEIIWVLFVHKHTGHRRHCDMLSCIFRRHWIEKSIRLIFFSNIRIKFLENRNEKRCWWFETTVKLNSSDVNYTTSNWFTSCQHFTEFYKILVHRNMCEHLCCKQILEMAVQHT
jgi:hypothetical protein